MDTFYTCRKWSLYYDNIVLIPSPTAKYWFLCKKNNFRTLRSLVLYSKFYYKELKNIVKFWMHVQGSCNAFRKSSCRISWSKPRGTEKKVCIQVSSNQREWRGEDISCECHRLPHTSQHVRLGGLRRIRQHLGRV